MKIIKTGVKPYLLFCAASLLTGGLSALLTAKNMSLYDSVNKPLLSPPAARFPHSMDNSLHPYGHIGRPHLSKKKS